VTKHSGARHATLEAVHVPGLLRVRVSDDGTGGARVEGGPGRNPGRQWPRGGRRAGNADDLLAAVGEHHPDAAVVDVRMPPGYTDEGLRAAIAIRRDHPKTGVLVFSQYIETRYAADLLGAASGGGAAGVGYLLKDRVGDVEEFVEALSRVAAGGTALDPEVVTQLLGASRRNDGLAALTARERDVLALMAEGRSNAAIAEILVVSERSVEKHVGNIFSKLGLAPSDADHRRVLAVLRYLES
jgi:DNA-binding NarL/FixJ family response regulator